MTVQVAQIHSPESGLLQDSHVQINSDDSFQQYLDEEQKRLSLMLSPFGQFNFSSWFQYANFSFISGSPANDAPLFSDMNPAPAETYASQPRTPPARTENGMNRSAQTFEQLTGYYGAKPAQSLLQDLLVKTGWLVPNLEGRPLFYQAQLEGKMISKLDLQFLIDQILSQVKLVKEKGKVELTLGLKPENLGEILLTLTSKSGMVSIQIQAPAETRKLIEDDLHELELALKKAKVNLAEIKVLNPKEVNHYA